MAVVPLPVGKLNLDKGPSPGDHLWVAKDAIMNDSGYEKLPEWSQTLTQAVTSGHLPRGVFCWRGGQTGRMYIATDSNIWEASDSAVTDVTGSTTPTNATNGMSFAGYGEWCFASNGINKIQAIKVPSSLASTDNFLDMAYSSGGAKISPKYIWSHKNHLMGGNIKFYESYNELGEYTTGAGTAFTNQPGGPGGIIKFSSSSAADTSGTVTIFGTTGGLSMVREDLALNGTTVVSGATLFAIVMGVLVDVAHAGTVTITNAGGATITSMVAGTNSSGVENIPAAEQNGGDRVVDVVAVGGATTKRLGIAGTLPDGTAVLSSISLNGTTTVQTTQEFRTITNVFTGDLEATRTAVLSSHEFPAGFTDPYLVWWSGIDDPEGYGTEELAPQIVGSSNQPLLDGVGEITGGADGGDCFFVFKTGCVYRFDGPPFQPTVIEGSVGMAKGNVSYKQGDRIYFWADCGLCYIDIKSNTVVKLMGGSVQRSVLDYAAANFGSLNGGFPDSRQSTVTYTNSVSTGTVVSISGDSVNSVVYVIYRNASAAGSHGLMYLENFDAFCQTTGPSGSNNSSTYVVDYRSGSGQIPGLLTHVRCVSFSDATHFQINKMTPGGFATTTTRDVYLRWPFMSAAPGGAKSRVLRVKPVFDNPIVSASTAVYNIRVEVVSLSGVRKSWKTDGVFSLGNATTSLDGWITVDGCPFADKHSIGISVLSTASHSGPNPLLSGFTGIEVDYMAAPSKSI